MTYVKQGILRGNAPVSVMGSPTITSSSRAVLVRQLPSEIVGLYSAFSADTLVYPIFWSEEHTTAQLVLQRVSIDGDVFTETIALESPTAASVMIAVDDTVGFRARSVDGYLQIGCADPSDVEIRIMPSAGLTANVASLSDPIRGLFRYSYVSNSVTSPDPRSFAYRGQVVPSPSRYEAPSTSATTFIYKNEDRTSQGINRSLVAISENAEIAYSRVTAERFETRHLDITEQSEAVTPGEDKCVWLEDVYRSDYYGAVAISSETLRVQVPSYERGSYLYLVLDSDNAPSLRAGRVVDLSDPQGSDADLFGQDVVVSEVYTARSVIPTGAPDYTNMHLVSQGDYATYAVYECGFTRIDSVTVQIDLPLVMQDLHENMPVRLSAPGMSNVDAEVDFVAGERSVSLRMREGSDRALVIPESLESGTISFLRGYTNTHKEIVVLKFRHRIRRIDAERRPYKLSVRVAKRLTSWDGTGDRAADALDRDAILEAIKRSDSPLRFDMRGTPITNLHTLRSVGAFGNNFIGLEKMSSSQISNNYLLGTAGLNDLLGLSPVSKLMSSSGAPILSRRHRLPMSVRAASGLMQQYATSPAATAAKSAYQLESYQYAALDYSFRREQGVTGDAQYQPKSGLLYTEDTSPFVPEDEGRILLLRGRTVIGQRELDKSDYVAIKQFISNKRVTVESVTPCSKYASLPASYAVDYFFVDLDIADRLSAGSAFVTHDNDSVTLLSPEGSSADVTLNAISKTSSELYPELSETSTPIDLTRAFSTLRSTGSGLQIALGYFEGSGALVGQIDNGRFAATIISTSTPLGLFDHGRVLRKLGIYTTGGSVQLSNVTQPVSSFMGGVAGQATWREGQFGYGERYVLIRGSVSYFSDAAQLSDTSSKPTHVKYSGWYRCTDVAVGADGRIYIDVEPLVPIEGLYSHSDFSEYRSEDHTVVPLCVCTFFAPANPTIAWGSSYAIRPQHGESALLVESSGSITGEPAAEVHQVDSATPALSVVRDSSYGVGGYLPEVYKTLRVDMMAHRNHLERAAPAFMIIDAGGAVDVAREVSRSYGSPTNIIPFSTMAVSQPGILLDSAGTPAVGALTNMKPAGAFLKPQVDVSTQGDTNGSQFIREPALIAAAYPSLSDIPVQLRGALSAARPVEQDVAQRAHWRAPASFNGQLGQPVESSWEAGYYPFTPVPALGYDTWDRDSAAVHAAGDVIVDGGVLCVNSDLKSNASNHLRARRSSGINAISGVGSHLVPVADAGLQPTIDLPLRSDPTFTAETPDGSALPNGETASSVLPRVYAEKYGQAVGRWGYPSWAARLSRSASRSVVSGDGGTAVDALGFYSNRLRLGESRAVWSTSQYNTSSIMLGKYVSDVAMSIIAGLAPEYTFYLPVEMGVVPADIGRSLYVYLSLTSAGVGDLFNGSSVPGAVKEGDHIAGVQIVSLQSGYISVGFPAAILRSEEVLGVTRYVVATPDLRETLFRSDVGYKWVNGTSAIVVRALGRRWDLNASEVDADTISIHAEASPSTVYVGVANSKGQRVATMPTSERIRLSSGTSGAVFRAPITAIEGIDTNELSATSVSASDTITADVVRARISEIGVNAALHVQTALDTQMDASIRIDVPMYYYGTSSQGFGVTQAVGSTTVYHVEPYVRFDMSDDANLMRNNICVWRQQGSFSGSHTVASTASINPSYIFDSGGNLEAMGSVSHADYLRESFTVSAAPADDTFGNTSVVVCSITRDGGEIASFTAQEVGQVRTGIPGPSESLNIGIDPAWANQVVMRYGNPSDPSDIRTRFGYRDGTSSWAVGDSTYSSNLTHSPYPQLGPASLSYSGNRIINGLNPISIGRAIYAAWNPEIRAISSFFPSQYSVELPMATLDKLNSWITVSIPSSAIDNPFLGTRSTRYGSGILDAYPRNTILYSAGPYAPADARDAADPITTGQTLSLRGLLEAAGSRYNQYIPIPDFIDNSWGTRWLSSQTAGIPYSQLATTINGSEVIAPSALSADLIITAKVSTSGTNNIQYFKQVVELRNVGIGEGFFATYACIEDPTLLSGCRWARVG